VCISTKVPERWVLAPGFDAVNPVGAAILAAQPTMPEPQVAGCVALGVSAVWMMGFVAGLGGEFAYASWQKHPLKSAIEEAHAFGREIREMLMASARRSSNSTPTQRDLKPVVLPAESDA